MSWSVSYIGVPDKINAKLDEFGETLTGQSKQEFDEAKPHLQSLLAQNVGQNAVVRLNASGHATFHDGTKQYGNCLVSIEQFYSSLAF